MDKEMMMNLMTEQQERIKLARHEGMDTKTMEHELEEMADVLLLMYHGC